MSTSNRGKLKIFMGYAAGVGKTYKMLEEAQELKSQGIDVVVGYFESHGRADTIAKAEGLETVARKVVEYRGSRFEEMDVDALVARKPSVAVVDEFPHTNIPGCRNGKRWEDVHMLLDAGIDVLTTMNIQHLESLNDKVWEITNVRVRETIPDWVVRQADEVVMIDVTPRALLNRLERGVVYGREKAQHALQNFFRESSLVALRELTLREAAHEVEHRIPNGEPHTKAPERAAPRRDHKILALVTADPKTAMVIRRARRVSDFLGAPCFAVSVLHGNLTPEERQAVEKHLSFAKNLHIETAILEGEDVAASVIEFARKNAVTQIFVARPQISSWGALFTKDPVQKIINGARDRQIVIVSDREPVKH